MRKRIDVERYRTMFSDPELSFVDIARIMNVTRERVRQIYRDYFRAEFGQRIEASALRSSRTRRRVFEEAANAEGMSYPKQLVWNLASDAGLEVSRLVSTSIGNIRATKTLIINRHICEISYARPLLRSRRGIVRYSRHRCTDPDIEFLICLRQPDERAEVFIIPTKELTKYSQRDVFIPAERRGAYRNRQARIDFWKYLNAWYLLK